MKKQSFILAGAAISALFASSAGAQPLTANAILTGDSIPQLSSRPINPGIFGSSCAALCTITDYYGQVVQLASADDLDWSPTWDEQADVQGCKNLAREVCDSNHSSFDALDKCSTMFVRVHLEYDNGSVVNDRFRVRCNP